MDSLRKLLNMNKNIASAYLEAMAEDGKTTSDALAILNEHLGTQHKWNRIWEWANGSRPIPDDVLRVMLPHALPWIVKQESGRRIINSELSAKIARWFK